MYSHGYDWREEPKGTALSSILLLLVFMGAVVFVVSMALMRPWADETAPVPVAEVQEQPAPPADASAPQVEQPAPGP
jgi:hypothetical protein